MVKRGLSAEEKKTKLIQIFNNAKEPLMLKEVRIAFEDVVSSTGLKPVLVT